jgi:hypothetical protein
MEEIIAKRYKNGQQISHFLYLTWCFAAGSVGLPRALSTGRVKNLDGIFAKLAFSLLTGRGFAAGLVALPRIIDRSR